VAWSPPSGEHHNGLLQGFRLFYKPMSSQQQSTSAFEFHSPESFRVDSKRVGNVGDSILHGLQAYQNYSIQVSAINRAGNGPLSAPIMCQTDENGKNYFLNL
jgi:Fibronectin type III domain